MDDTHEEFRKLLLAYEELDAAEQSRVDAHCASCESCRQTSVTFRELDKDAQSTGTLVDLDNEAAYRLSNEDARQERESFYHLREQFQDTERTGLLASLVVATRHLLSPRVYAPVAIALAALVLWMGPLSPPTIPELTELTLLEASEPWSARRSAVLARDGQWRSGEAFSICATFDQDAYAVVYHLDPLLEWARLLPENSNTDTNFVTAGELLRLPTSESGETWLVGVEPGVESFLVVATDEREIDFGSLDELIADLTASAEGRPQLLESVRELLEEQIGRVDLVELKHSR